MKLAIVGSRGYSEDRFNSYMDKYIKFAPKITAIISGGASGPDSFAEKFAEKYDIPTVIFPADWNRYGKSAGYKRNVQIIESCDQVLAFYDGTSRGTKLSIDLARQKNKPIEVIYSAQ